MHNKKQYVIIYVKYGILTGYIMKINGTENNIAVLKELGKRIKAYRINYPMTREELAIKSDVSVRTIARIEDGESSQLENIIRILRALDCLGRIDLLVPEQEIRPSMIYKEGKMRKRAQSPKYRENKRKDGWTWGEDK